MKRKPIRTLVGVLAVLLILAFGQHGTQGATLKAPTLKSISNTSSGVKITWKTLSWASGYLVLRKTASSPSYKVIKTLTGAKSSYTDKTAVPGETDTYTIQGFVVSGSTRTLGKYNASGLSIYYVPAPSLVSLKDSEKGLTLKWTKVDAATSYAVYRKEGSGSYQKLKKISNPDTVKYTDKTAILGHTYTYTVRAFIGSAYGAKAKALTGSHTKTSFEGEDTGVYRALLVGECQYFPRYFNLNYPNYDPTNNLYSPYYDVRVMRNLLKDCGYQVQLMDSPTKRQILSAITSTFGAATSDDVCLFYYSGHGVSDRNTNTGALLTPSGNGNTEYLTLAELAEALDAIPSRIIVMLDSCGSGAAILPSGFTSTPVWAGEDLSPDASQAEEPFYPAAFNGQVMEAFFSGGHLNKSGEFLQEEKYYVLTSSRTWQNSVITVLSGNIHASLMTLGVADGAGYSFLSSGWNGTVPADKNADNAITLEEAYQYAYREVLELSQSSGNTQNVQRFPVYSSFVLYGR